MSSPGSASATSGGVGNGRGSLRTSAESEEGTDPLPMYGTGHCKWFNVRMGFGFISMTSRGGNPIDPPLDVFVHQSKLHMEGFRSLKEGEAVEFTFKKSSKGLECVRVTGPGGVHCVGSEKRPKGKSMQQKRKPKGDRCYNCGGLDHHAKECCLPPQPKKCHYCQSAAHMVAHCPHKASSAAQGRYSLEPPASSSGQAPSPHSSDAGQRTSYSSQDCSASSKPSSSPEDPTTKAASSQRKKRKK
ncbi:protein lin-28 homolog A-like isoform X1 [Colossoma macropomum]|uniref:protein lin-28 homolog A-like isoform X1 n=1 Tax=Colossoma macropomum TaxID=42526 RepID=UPI0018653CDE|nr:protein lin-28 homolog A-like isoform X1 [Colossoma macropomum]XP_036442305.1 protein lin-28 homolog A-like isoform X1 [Colossoma macropomum]